LFLGPGLGNQKKDPVFSKIKRGAVAATSKNPFEKKKKKKKEENQRLHIPAGGSSKPTSKRLSEKREIVSGYGFQ